MSGIEKSTASIVKHGGGRRRPSAVSVSCRRSWSLEQGSEDGSRQVRKQQSNGKDNEKYLGEDGKPQVEKMNLITYEPVRHVYLVLGERVGNAFSDGKKFK